MKKQIIEIGKDLEQGKIDENKAQTKLLNLFGVSGCYYCFNANPPWWVRWFFAWECPKCGKECNNH